MKAQRPARGPQGGSGALLEIMELRSGSAYRAAELLRQRIGVTTMAASPRTSDEYAAVRLLIGIWDTIAHVVRSGDIDKYKLFETNPVLLMWNDLEHAVRTIRRSGVVSADYARDFERLAGDYRRWIRTPAGRRFRSSAAQAIHANFG
jgi:hypothetical protein